MKKLLSLSLGLFAILNLAGCCCFKKPTCTQKQQEKNCNSPEESKRISGPLSEKEVGWEEEDYS